MSSSDQRVWVLLDDRAGNRAQAEGVAGRLTSNATPIDIRYGPLAKLPNALLGASVVGLTSGSKAQLVAPWPDLVIAAGRRTAPVARWIKKRSGGQTRLVQIMDPGSGHADFDLICRPAHDDGAAADNVLTIDAAPHRLTDETLAAARAEWLPRVEAFAAPRIALLIGGSTRRRKFTDAMAVRLCQSVHAAVEKCDGSILATTSRRTGAVVETVAATLIDRTMLYRWDRPGDNPYLGFLASADAIVVTGESVSMCSEACATGKPVYIFAPSELIAPKHARLHRRLFDGGYAQPFEGYIDLEWKLSKLDVTADIVDAIKQRDLWKS